MIKDGKVAEEGAPEALYNNENGIFRRMADLQAQSARWRV